MRSTCGFAYPSGRGRASRIRRALVAALLPLLLLGAASPCFAVYDLTFRDRLRAKADREGPILDTIEFAGNYTFDRKTLLRYMTLSESGIFHTVRYKRRVMERDLANLERFYETQGFLQAQAVVEDENLSDDWMRIDVLVGIYEGPRWEVASITFEGNRVLDEQQLMRDMSLAPGGPYLPNELDGDRRSVLNAYARRSYLDARVFQTVDVDDDTHTARVHYRIVERQQAVIASIDVTGDEKTRQFVIERELTLKPGDLFDPEQIGESQAKIYRTGLFNSVWLEPARQDTGKAMKQLLVSVRERPRGLSRPRSRP